MRTIIGIIGSILIISLLAGCAAPTPTEPVEPERVEITLTEFGVEASITEFEVGQPYEFVITNEGAINHEFRIMPVSGAQAGHNEEGHSSTLVVVEEEELEVGETITVEYTFTNDALHSDLEIACHIEGHYEAGMNLPISIVN
jgi:uncharacterized cupredoxin-like copper-binding protein